ncbi:hypothetical protein [Streptomyces sp. ODS28]|uniref:hypothetical protein n=1 Tax=Streptomyces sp. ODS28 TaxID=3136688 RepID=UPI0031EA22FE
MAEGPLLLTLLMGRKIAVPVPAPITDALRSVQVTTTAGQASGFQLTFAVSKPSVIDRVLLPTGLLDPETRVIVMVILNGRPQVLMDGIVMRQDVAPSGTPGASTLTVTGEDLTAVMDLAERTACYPAMSSDDQVKAICRHYAEYGIIPAAVPPVLREVPSPADRIQVQTETDLAYIKALADDAGYVFYLEPGPAPGVSIAYWGPEIRVGVPQPALSVNMDTASNVESLSFSYDGRSRAQMTVTITEPFTRQQIPVPIPDVGLLRPPLAARRAVALRQVPVPDTAKLTPIGAALMGLSMTAEANDAVTGQGSLDVLRYGHILKARALVGVRGAGLTYDGLFYVRSVTHDISRGTYKQSFTLARDGLVSQTPVVRP